MSDSFQNVAFKLIKSGFTYKFINGPINKKLFLKQKIFRYNRVYFKEFSMKIKLQC